MKLGVMIEGQEGLNWERWENIVGNADRLGFDSVWRSDHLYSVMGKYERETLALVPSLTAVPIWSDRLIFGQLVSPISFREPVHLAYEAATLDKLSDGRYMFGIGAGWNESEHRAFGFRLPPLKERMDRLEESLKLITLLWSGERVDFQGEYYQLDMARAALTPTGGKANILIGGGGEKRTLRLVAEYADEWNVTPTPPDVYDHKVEVLEQHCKDVGRNPSEITKSIMLSHIIGADEKELEERARNYMAITGREDSDPSEVMNGMRERGLLVGTPDEVIESIKMREAQGIDRIMMQTMDMDDMAVLELIANEIMPEVS
ncbi:MAG: TIGR03560 family F420-dependent LLM class oxidoreductase [Thermomicrobiales bacterium]